MKLRYFLLCISIIEENTGAIFVINLVIEEAQELDGWRQIKEVEVEMVWTRAEKKCFLCWNQGVEVGFDMCVGELLGISAQGC